MPFNERAKTIALAIVHIFETAKPLGDYGAVAVLSDGAGFSVGINQFTHKSGSLAAVIDRFVKLGGNLPTIIKNALPDFRSGRNIDVRSSNKELKTAIKSLAPDEKWRQAQREIAFENYLEPALKACEGSGFIHPLSLAVVYDSINQGGYATVRDKVSASDHNEKAWITEYCAARKMWLSRNKKPIVRTTVYRPNFFLGQIAAGNWNLDLPLAVNGHRLTSAKLFGDASLISEVVSTEQPDHTAADTGAVTEPPAVTGSPNEQPPTATEITEVETSTGVSAVSTTIKNEQDINTPAVVDGVKPYNDIGLKDTLKGDAKAILPANLGLNTISEVIQQTTGWPAWLSALIPKLVIAALIVTAVWLLYRLVSYLTHQWRENERVKLLASINSDPTRKDLQLQ